MKNKTMKKIAMTLAVVVRSSRKAGTFVLRAQSDTVPSASAEIKTVERSVAESVENP